MKVRCSLLIIGGVLELLLFIYFEFHRRSIEISSEAKEKGSKYLSSLQLYETRSWSYYKSSTESLLAKDVYDRFVSISQNANITLRAEKVYGLSDKEQKLSRKTWQAEQVKRFCEHHKFKTAYDLLDLKKRSTQLFRHLIFDDQRHLLFCFIPKVGCSNLRRLMLVMQGRLPVETAKNASISEHSLINPESNKISFSSKTLTNSGRLERLQTYYKFVMIRNPLERLISAYRDKIEPIFSKSTPTTTCIVDEIQYEDELFFENHKHFILSRYRPLDLLQWQSTSGTLTLQVTFSDYVQWIIDTNEMSLNEHFSMQLTNARPCMVNYHFYANFKNYSRDVRLLIKHLNTSEDYFTDHATHPATSKTRAFLGHYYSQLSTELKYRLFHRMLVELDFYYHLNPEEQWSHTELLGITEPVLL